MSPDKMVHQANQIAKFFETQHGGEAVERTAQHLNDFWEPRMRTQLLTFIDQKGIGLRETVLAAAKRLSAPV